MFVNKNHILQEPNQKTEPIEISANTQDISLTTIYNELLNIKSLLQNNKSLPGKMIFNNKTLSTYLEVSTRTLQNWRDAGMISFTQVKDVIFYSEEDVATFMNKYKRKAFK